MEGRRRLWRDEVQGHRERRQRRDDLPPVRGGKGRHAGAVQELPRAAQRRPVADAQVVQRGGQVLHRRRGLLRLQDRLRHPAAARRQADPGDGLRRRQRLQPHPQHLAQHPAVVVAGRQQAGVHLVHAAQPRPVRRRRRRRSPQAADPLLGDEHRCVVVAGRLQDRPDPVQGRQPRDLPGQRVNRQDHQAAHQQPRHRDLTELVARRQAAGVRLRPRRRPADLRDERQRLQPAPGVVQRQLQHHAGVVAAQG